MADESKSTYEIDLKDSLSPKIDRATEHVEHFESTLKSVKNVVLGVGSAIGGAFIGYRIFDFIKESREEADRLAVATTGLQNTMTNMGIYSKEAFDKAVKGAQDLAGASPYSRDGIIELQSQLGVLGNIGQDSMNKLTQASADMATKFNMDLLSAGQMLARTFNNPEYAIFLSRKLEIPPEVMKHLKDLAAHGKEAQARLELLAITESKVGGAAKAAFDANPLAQYNLAMYNLKLEVGEAAAELLRTLAPAFIKVVNGIKDTVHWMKEHKDIASALGIAIGIVGGVLLAYEVTLKAVAIWEGVVTVATWAWNAALDANPIMLVVTGITLIIAGLIQAYRHFGIFHATVWGIWAALKAFAEFIVFGPIKVLYELGEAILNIFHPTEMLQHLNNLANIVFDGAKNIGKAYSTGFKEGMADFNSSLVTPSLIPDLKNKPQTADNYPPINKPIATKATGSKSVTINVSIKDLIGNYNSNVTNIKENNKQLRDLVVETLESAMNDFQVVAEH